MTCGWFDSAEQPIGSGSDLWHSLPRTLRSAVATIRPRKDLQTARAVYRSLRPNIFSALHQGATVPLSCQDWRRRLHRVQGAVALLDRESGTSRREWRRYATGTPAAETSLMLSGMKQRFSLRT